MGIINRPVNLSLEERIPLSRDIKLQNIFKVIEGSISGNVRFGIILEKMDMLAYKTARLFVDQFHPDARVVTAAIDTIIMRNVFDINKDIVLKSRINYVGKSSMEVGIKIEQLASNDGHIATCYFTMVARLGNLENDMPAKLPPLDYIDDHEKERYYKALERKEHYMQDKKKLVEPPGCDEFRHLFEIHRESKSVNIQEYQVSMTPPSMTSSIISQPPINEISTNTISPITYKTSKGFVNEFIMESWERTFPEHKNLNQTIFGGYLARRAYELSSMCAELLAKWRGLIGAVNRINFYQPVNIGDKLHYASKIIYTNGPFICIEANISRMGRGEKKISALTNSCLFTFIDVDENLNPLIVDKIYPVTFEEYLKYLQAERSMKRLLQEPEDIYLNKVLQGNKLIF